MRILTVAEMKAAERAAAAAGTSYSQLMENAGAAAALAMERMAAQRELAHTALFLCGRGNNAGDAFVAARLLAEKGWRCAVLPLCGDDYAELAAANFFKLPESVEKATQATADFGAAFIVDGVFGTGFHGALPAAVHDAFVRANAEGGALRVALDLPSGLDGDSGDIARGTFAAHLTVTFGAYKPGLLVRGAEAYTGEVECADIGL